jgi:hypothetical protein
MNNDVLNLLRATIGDLDSRAKTASAVPAITLYADNVTRDLIGLMPTPETDQEILKLSSALESISADTGRGNGSIYFVSGQAPVDYWLAVVWGVASLQWNRGKELAKQWSMSCDRRFDNAGFETAWNSYKSNHANSIGIGSVYMLAKQFGWQPHSALPSPTLQSTSSRYNLLDRNGIRALKPIQWRLKDILPAHGIAALFGPSGSGKSFVALDMACRIASGDVWFGHKTSTAPVIYVALEGESGFKNRVEAWELENQKQIPLDLRMVLQPFDITRPQDITELAIVVPTGSVVIVDTLNRAAPTVDENSGAEMGLVIQAAKRLQSHISGLVLLVHHTGKDAAKGLRGHSSLHAALDAAIEIRKTVQGFSLNAVKVKDGAGGTQHMFALKSHHLGLDADGDPINSCTVEPDIKSVYRLPDPKGSHQRAALTALRSAIGNSIHHGKAATSPVTPCISMQDAISAVAAVLFTTAANKRNNRSRTLIGGLISSTHLKAGVDTGVDWVWL